MELQLQVTEEELLEFPEVRSNQFNTSHSDKPAGKVVIGTIVLKREAASRIAVEVVEGVVPIHIPRLKLKKPYYK